MPDHSLINNAKKALSAPFESRRFAPLSNTIAYQGQLLLEKVESSKLSDEEIRKEVDIITAGSLVCALAFNQLKYKRSHYLTHISQGESAPLYYPLTFDLLHKLSPVANKKLVLDIDNLDFITLVRHVGKQVMEGHLPFDLTVMEDINPDHKKFMRDLAARIRNRKVQSVEEDEYTLLQKAFEKAIQASDPVVNETNEHKKKFIVAITKLSQQALAEFSAKTPLFSFQNCSKLAENAHNLASKVGEGRVQKQDVDDFVAATKPFSTSKWFPTVLGAIVGAVLGMIAGAAVGFVFGGIPGALLGAGVGLATLGFFGAGIALTIPARERDHIRQMSNAAAALAQP